MNLEQTKKHLAQLDDEFQKDIVLLKEQHKKAREPYIKIQRELVREQNQKTWHDFLKSHMQELSREVDAHIALHGVEEGLHCSTTPAFSISLPNIPKVGHAYLICNFHTLPVSGIDTGELEIDLCVSPKHDANAYKNLFICHETKICPQEVKQKIVTWVDQVQSGKFPAIGKVTWQKL